MRTRRPDQGISVTVPGAGTPKSIIDRLHNEFVKILQLPGMKEKLLHHGAFATSSTPEQATRRIHSEIAMWAKVIKEANITPDQESAWRNAARRCSWDALQELSSPNSLARTARFKR